MTIKVLVSGIFLAGILLLACAPKEAASTTPDLPTPAAGEKATAQKSWEVEWERTVKAAQRERMVIIYSTYSGEARKAIANAFVDKYGIKAEFITGRGDELVARLLQGRRSGIYEVDFFLMGVVVQALQEPGLITDGVLAPVEPLLMLPEVIDPKVWWGNKLGWVDEGKHLLGFMAYPLAGLYINRGAVNPNETKSWRDLLAPKWKEKITINDPTISGGGNGWFSMMGNNILDWDYMREMVNQKPVILRDLRLQAEWLAHGKYPIAIGLPAYAVAEFTKAGVPITPEIPAEGGYVASGSGNIYFISRAPHPAASRIFVNWLLSREGQTLVSSLHQTQSGRLDVPTDHLSPTEIRREGVNYFDQRTKASRLAQIKAVETAKEIFGPLLK